MSRFSFGEPFTRKQCVIVLLVLLLGAWTVALIWYANVRQGTWHVVEARIIETQYESDAQGNVVLYEFEARPYLAMLPDVRINKNAFYPGAALSVYVNDANPSRAVLTPQGQLQVQFIHAAVLILSSAFGLYLAFRLMKTLEIERVSEQSRGLVDSMFDELGQSTGWSEAFVELLSREEEKSIARRSRASGGSGPTTLA